MIKKNLKNLNFENEHLSEEVLLMLVDGELSAKESSNAHEHLKICWTCRGKLEKIEETITSFVDFRKKIQTPLQPPPPDNWNAFNSNLNKIRQEEFQVTNNLNKPPAGTNWFSRLFSNSTILFSSGWRRFALACCVVIIAVGGWMIFEQQPRLSAKAILEVAEVKKLNWQYQPGKILFWEEEEKLQSPSHRYRSKRWSNNLNGQHERLMLRYDEQNQLVWGKWVKADGAMILYQGKEKGITIYPGTQPIKEKMPTLSEQDKQVLEKHLVSNERNTDSEQQSQLHTNWMLKNYTSELVRTHEVEGNRKAICVFIRSGREKPNSKVKASEMEVDYDEKTFQRVLYRLTFHLDDGRSTTEEARLLTARESTLEEFQNNALAHILAEGKQVKYLSVEEFARYLRRVYLPDEKSNSQ